MKKVDLTMGKTTLIDEADFDRVSQYKWCFDGSYAARNNWDSERRRSRKQYLHHFLIEKTPGLVVDHVNGDRLDNRRSNLRLVSAKDNARSRHRRSGRSQFKGVRLVAGKYWMAQITVDGTNKYLGYWPTEIAAAEAYDRAAREHFGEFAVLNFKESA